MHVPSASVKAVNSLKQGQGCMFLYMLHRASNVWCLFPRGLEGCILMVIHVGINFYSTLVQLHKIKIAYLCSL